MDRKAGILLWEGAGFFLLLGSGALNGVFAVNWWEPVDWWESVGGGLLEVV